MSEIVVKLVNGELAGKTAQELAKEVGLAARELNKAKIGTQEWIAASEKLNKAKDLQADMKKQLEGTTKASDMLRQAWNKLPGAQFFNQIAESIGMAKTGVGGLISSMGMLKGAIAATGIGLLVIVLGTLYSWFKKVNTGADLLEDIFSSIGTTLDVVIGRLSRFGAGIVQFLSGDFAKGIDTMSNAFKGMGDEIMNDVEAIQQLNAARRDLEDAEIDYRIKAAQTENQIKRLMLQARNRTLSEQERIALLEQALVLEKNLNNEQLKNSEEALRIANEDAALILNIKKQATESQIEFGKRILEEFKVDGQAQADDLRDKVADMLVAMEDASGKSLALQEKIINQRDALLDKEEAELKKWNDNWLKQQSELEKFEEERQENDLKREIDHRDKKAIVSMNAAAAQLAARILHNNMLTEEDRKAFAEREKALKEHLELVKQNEQRASEQMLATTVMLGNEILNSRLNNSRARLDSLRAQHGEESAIYKQAAREEGDRIKENERTKIRLNLIGEIAAIWRGAANFGPLASIVAGIQTGAAIIRAGSALKNVDRLKFGGGGAVLRGPRHRWGGIPIEAEGGEIVLTRGVFRNPSLRAMASAINVAGGGRQFALGGPVSPYSEGRNSAPQQVSLPGFDDLKRMLQGYAEAMDRRIDRIQVTNNLQDTQRGITVLNQLKADADV